MTSEFKEMVRDELQCSLCYNMIMDPRVLQCPHTFCLECLEKSYAYRLRRHRVTGTDVDSPVREDEFECPLCRQITHLPDPDPVQPTRGRIASLSTNLPLKNVARLLAEREANRRPVPIPRSTCEVHRVTLDNYCEACGELVCYKCMHCPPHSNHKQSVHLAADVLQDRAGVLRALAEDIATKASSVKQAQEAVQERLVENRDQIIQAIEFSHEKKLALLRKRVDGLLAAVQENTEGKLAALKQSLQMLDEAKKFASQTDSSVEQMMTDKDLGILAKEKSLLQELRTHQQAVQEESERLSGSEVKLDLVLKFEEDSNFDHCLSTFGHLTEYQYERDPSHSHPLLRVKHEFRIGKDGKTYIESTPASLPPQLEYGMLPPLSTFMMQHFGVPYPAKVTDLTDDYGPGYVFAANYPAAMARFMPTPLPHPAYGEQHPVNSPFRDGRLAEGSFASNKKGPPGQASTKPQGSAMPKLYAHALIPEDPKYESEESLQPNAFPGRIPSPIRTNDVHLHVGEIPDNFEDSDGEYCYTSSTEATCLVSSLTSSRDRGALEGSLSSGSCESAPVDDLHDSMPEEPRNPTGVSMIAEISHPFTPQPLSSPPSQSSSHNPTPSSSPKCKRRASPTPSEQLIPCSMSNPSTESFPEELYEEFDVYEQFPQEPGDLYDDPRAYNPTGVSVIIEDAPPPNISGAHHIQQYKESRTSTSRSSSLPSSPAASRKSSPHSSIQGPIEPNHPTDEDPEEAYELPLDLLQPPDLPQPPDPSLGEPVYEEMDMLECPPVAHTVRRPRYDSLPPIPTDTGRLSHGKAWQPTWMLASHPPLLPLSQLKQPKTSLIKPIQIIENDQFMPESTIDVCPSGVSCTGTYNNIVITDTSNHCLRVVERNGRFVTKIGRRGGGSGCFNMPVALAISSDNFYYVVDQRNARIQKFTAYEAIELIFGEKKGRQLLKKPQGIAVHRVTGDVYVADSDKKRIYVYQSDGTYVRPIGKKEKGISFNCPVAVAISKSDQLLVVDRSSQANGRHCVWCIRQPEMELIRKIGEGVLENPSGIAVAEDGTILVTELDSGSICVFSQTGDPIHRFGQTGTDPGMFNQPCGVCINSEGQVVVADKGNHRLQVFSLKDILKKD